MNGNKKSHLKIIRKEIKYLELRKNLVCLYKKRFLLLFLMIFETHSKKYSCPLTVVECFDLI